MNIQKKLRAGLFGLLAVLPLAFSASPTSAQSSTVPFSTPHIDGFDVEPATRLSAGHVLLFTLYGSPGGAATIRIGGAVNRFVLDEVETGVYEGTYTIRANDRMDANSTVTANLRVGNRIATEILDESVLLNGPSRSALKRSADAAAAASAPKIDRFEVGPVDRLSSGADLFFSVLGNPGAVVDVRISGARGKLTLEEGKAGVYEGIYTIKDRDRVLPASTATATLRLGGRETSVVLGESLLAGPGSMPSTRRSQRNCANCGVVESINLIEVNGNGSYLGKIAGGVVGAVIGSQIGSGRGTTAAEVAGAVGGAVAGNEIEKRVRKSRHYDVVTRLRDGGMQTTSYPVEPAFKVGDKVRVENGALVPDA